MFSTHSLPFHRDVSTTLEQRMACIVEAGNSGGKHEEHEQMEDEGGEQGLPVDSVCLYRLLLQLVGARQAQRARVS